ncbi:phosphoribosylaminoimidazole-succinocarboxamide synthase [Companilactobacillus sp. RD055328]|uniref:phosphoribosylaminoimidazolesuccinocarboxamide synthase n=1 Tax=Companilactobacillus sp. RD055328 TaxID=2916634 RepID=UPI001FC7E79B|nr:phosphoribosylaminoimidazolesuccinocarboxamide synthase [Companilactobacillus sp. RD055328]GKQ42590.1 phosphoribosylaminoimidazole-succinocarboxamide synthase [Companilactobacillus sp. RD055328]
MNELLYSGKAKDVFQTDEEDVLEIVYKDQATALNGKRKEIIKGKAKLNLEISTLIFQYLEKEGIKTHYIKNKNETTQIVKKSKIFPLEVVIRNYIAGSFSKKFDLTYGEKLKNPIYEFYYKSDELDDPFINDSQIVGLNIATQEEISEIKGMTNTINNLLIKIFNESGFDLVDFKLEFGVFHNEIILVDEFSPDNCRLWSKGTTQSFDKDVFRQKKGDLTDVYKTVLINLRKTLEE